ncbi:MAG: prepilin-type N-terminal cleavage/methylation domain-containing protein [Kiritimatiellaeota bacterium]|nr:prepilin-type N-terminal cleavage/methylation domain-containing protein [Kiritimatiellota bacterium]
MKKQKKGFTLVEIMIVVAIIALLAAIAVPSFMNARTKSQQSSCQNNLRLIDGAIQQYALDNSNALAASMAVLVGTNAYIKDTPVCKGGGSYTLPTTLAGKTSCSSHGTL